MCPIVLHGTSQVSCRSPVTARSRLYKRDPRRVTEVGLVHLDQEAEPAAAPGRP
jgi:hypothetical protein